MNKNRARIIVFLFLGCALSASGVVLLSIYMRPTLSVPVYTIAILFIVVGIGICALGIRSYMINMLQSLRSYVDASIGRMKSDVESLNARSVESMDGLRTETASINRSLHRSEKSADRQNEVLQVVLSRLEATERRLVESVEASALTNANGVEQIRRRFEEEHGDTVHQAQASSIATTDNWSQSVDNSSTGKTLPVLEFRTLDDIQSHLKNHRAQLTHGRRVSRKRKSAATSRINEIERRISELKEMLAELGM